MRVTAGCCVVAFGGSDKSRLVTASASAASDLPLLWRRLVVVVATRQWLRRWLSVCLWNAQPSLNEAPLEVSCVTHLVVAGRSASRWWSQWPCQSSAVLHSVVEPGVKVDGRYYRDVLLKQQMLPIMRRIADKMYVFQQDSIAAHRAHDIVQLLQQQTPEFIAPDLWPPNSPDLNPVDYRVWGLMQEQVYKTGHM